jgi:hypothetical protein
MAETSATLTAEKLELSASSFATLEGFAQAVIKAALWAAAEKIRSGKPASESIKLDCAVTVEGCGEWQVDDRHTHELSGCHLVRFKLEGGYPVSYCYCWGRREDP